jgi:hypothetical protein
MAGRLPDEIERLLAEAGGGLDSPAREALRARLAASLAQGLDSHSGADRRADDPADNLSGLAAFLDGQLTGAAREAFVQNLVEAPGRRAELDSAAALLDTVGDGAPVAPKLLAQAAATFAPAVTPTATAAKPSWWALGRPGARGIRVAVTAVLALVVLVPGIAMVGKRLQQDAAREKAPAAQPASPAGPPRQAETPRFGPRLDAASSREDFLGGQQPSPAASVSAPAQPANPASPHGCDTREGMVASRASPHEVSVVQSRKAARSLLRAEDPCRPADSAARPPRIAPAAPPPAALAAPPPHR